MGEKGALLLLPVLLTWSPPCRPPPTYPLGEEAEWGSSAHPDHSSLLRVQVHHSHRHLPSSARPLSSCDTARSTTVSSCPIYMEPCSHTQMPTEAAQGRRQAGPVCLHCHGHSGGACGPGTLGPEAARIRELGRSSDSRHSEPWAALFLRESRQGLGVSDGPAECARVGGSCRGSCQGTTLTPLGHTSHGRMPVCPGAEWSFQSQHDRIFHRYAH